MNKNEIVFNALYEFVMFELSRRETEFKNSKEAYSSNKSMGNMFAVIEAWIKCEYFSSWCNDLLEYLRYFIT